jgi:hypothetical protein
MKKMDGGNARGGDKFINRLSTRQSPLQWVEPNKERAILNKAARFFLLIFSWEETRHTILFQLVRH